MTHFSDPEFAEKEAHLPPGIMPWYHQVHYLFAPGAPLE
jgi:hypothetical protein